MRHSTNLQNTFKQSIQCQLTLIFHLQSSNCFITRKVIKISRESGPKRTTYLAYLEKQNCIQQSCYYQPEILSNLTFSLGNCLQLPRFPLIQSIQKIYNFPYLRLYRVFHNEMRVTKGLYHCQIILSRLLAFAKGSRLLRQLQKS